MVGCAALLLLRDGTSRFFWLAVSSGRPRSLCFTLLVDLFSTHMMIWEFVVGHTFAQHAFLLGVAWLFVGWFFCSVLITLSFILYRSLASGNVEWVIAGIVVRFELQWGWIDYDVFSNKTSTPDLRACP